VPQPNRQRDDDDRSAVEQSLSDQLPPRIILVEEAVDELAQRQPDRERCPP